MVSVSQWQKRNDLKIIEIPFSYCLHSHQTVQQKNPKAVED